MSSRTRIGRPAGWRRGGPGGFAAHGRTPPPGRRVLRPGVARDDARDARVRPRPRGAPRRAGVVRGRAQPLVRAGARGRRPGRREPPRRPRGRRGRDPALGARPAPRRRARGGPPQGARGWSAHEAPVRERRERREDSLLPLSSPPPPPRRRRAPVGRPQGRRRLDPRLAPRPPRRRRGLARARDENVRAPRERARRRLLGDPASAFSLRCPGRTLDLVAPNARDADAWATALDHLAARARGRARSRTRTRTSRRRYPRPGYPRPRTREEDPRGRPRAPERGFGGGALDPSPRPSPRPRPRRCRRARLRLGFRLGSFPGIARVFARGVHARSRARVGVALLLSRQGSLDRESASSAAPGAPSPDPRRVPARTRRRRSSPWRRGPRRCAARATSRSTSRTRRRDGGRRGVSRARRGIRRAREHPAVREPGRGRRPDTRRGRVGGDEGGAAS